MRKNELHMLIRQRADELAMTGKFDDYRDIETQLRFVEGFRAARIVLDDRTFRMLLNRTCAAAKARQLVN